MFQTIFRPLKGLDSRMQIKRPTSALKPFPLLPPLILMLCFGINVALAQPQELLHKADSLAKALQYEEANATLSAFITAYPQRKYDLGEAYFKMARNHFQLGHLETATQCNQQSADLRMAIAPDALGLNEQLSACICLEEGQYDTALEHLKKARLYPFFDDPLIPAEIALLESEIQEQRYQYDLALKAARSAAEIVEIVESSEAPPLSGIYLQQAHLLAIKQDWAAAVQACQASLKIEESPEANLLLGQALLADKQPSKEAKTALAKAQQRGSTAIQIEAGLALAQWELENGKPYGVLAQTDRISALINNQQGSRGKKAGANQPHSNQYYTQAQMKYLSAQAYLMETSADSHAQARSAVYQGLDALQRSEKEDTLLQAQLLEQGLMALTHPETGIQAFDKYLDFYLIFYPGRLQRFSSDPKAEAPGIQFFETRSAVFGLYDDADSTFMTRLADEVVRPTLSQLNSGKAEAVNYTAFQQLFGPFEALLAHKESLYLGFPEEWPAQQILQLPTTPEPEGGIWPFRHRPKPIRKKFKINDTVFD
ncbi:MAG: tetratricopeptide repeat protein [Phaeodactylibacter xiamenensis]|nr:hypothetical protein [Phaeodactylibacter xiamenensis]MCR9051311.1 hypothetical protein [bacterium]